MSMGANVKVRVRIRVMVRAKVLAEAESAFSSSAIACRGVGSVGRAAVGLEHGGEAVLVLGPRAVG